ncbi:uncharacterized protein A4U43_C03F26570 [Asparagus officinalis]|uniref:Uncharacterized protein n=1 Tax=Asparagus officinalis TaxID=4686 RepID=A0A5P1FIC5_ASPOF|nr:uncharacterized protein A4U43_C03F26570 [Asparagus officinalis]
MVAWSESDVVTVIKGSIFGRRHSPSAPLKLRKRKGEKFARRSDEVSIFTGRGPEKYDKVVHKNLNTETFVGVAHSAKSEPSADKVGPTQLTVGLASESEVTSFSPRFGFTCHRTGARRLINDDVEKVKSFHVDTIVPFRERLKILGRVANLEDLPLSAAEKTLMHKYNKKPLFSSPHHEFYSVKDVRWNAELGEIAGVSFLPEVAMRITRSSITREKIEELCGDLWDQALVPLKELLKHSGLGVDDIYAVELIGGATRVSKLQEFLGRKYLGKHLDADEVIVLGSSLHAANLSDGIKLNRKLGMIDGSSYGFVLELNGTDLVKDESTETLLVPWMKKMPIKINIVTCYKAIASKPLE